jgi:hypothetical protein
MIKTQKPKSLDQPGDGYPKAISTGQARAEHASELASQRAQVEALARRVQSAGGPVPRRA